MSYACVKINGQPVDRFSRLHVVDMDRRACEHMAAVHPELDMDRARRAKAAAIRAELARRQEAAAAQAERDAKHQAIMAAFKVKTVRLSTTPVQRSTVETIQAETATKHGLTRRELLSESRARRIVVPRQEAIYRALAETEHSLSQLGRMFGGLDHTTILHAGIRHAERNELPAPRGIGG